MAPKAANKALGRAQIIAATKIGFNTRKLKSTFVIAVIPPNLQNGDGYLMLAFAPLFPA